MAQEEGVGVGEQAEADAAAEASPRVESWGKNMLSFSN